MESRQIGRSNLFDRVSRRRNHSRRMIAIEGALEALLGQKLRYRTLKIERLQLPRLVFVDFILGKCRVEDYIREKTQCLIKILNQPRGIHDARETGKTCTRGQRRPDGVSLLGNILTLTGLGALAQQRAGETGESVIVGGV